MILRTPVEAVACEVVCLGESSSRDERRERDFSDLSQEVIKAIRTSGKVMQNFFFISGSQFVCYLYNYGYGKNQDFPFPFRFA